MRQILHVKVNYPEPIITILWLSSLLFRYQITAFTWSNIYLCLVLKYRSIWTADQNSLAWSISGFVGDSISTLVFAVTIMLRLDLNWSLYQECVYFIMVVPLWCYRKIFLVWLLDLYFRIYPPLYTSWLDGKPRRIFRIRLQRRGIARWYKRLKDLSKMNRKQQKQSN